MISLAEQVLWSIMTTSSSIIGERCENGRVREVIGTKRISHILLGRKTLSNQIKSACLKLQAILPTKQPEAEGELFLRLGISISLREIESCPDILPLILRRWDHSHCSGRFWKISRSSYCVSAVNRYNREYQQPSSIGLLNCEPNNNFDIYYCHILSYCLDGLRYLFHSYLFYLSTSKYHRQSLTSNSSKVYSIPPNHQSIQTYPKQFNMSSAPGTYIMAIPSDPPTPPLKNSCTTMATAIPSATRISSPTYTKSSVPLTHLPRKIPRGRSSSSTKYAQILPVSLQTRTARH